MRRSIIIILLFSAAFVFVVLIAQSTSAFFQLEVYPDKNGPIQPGIEPREINGFAKYTNEKFIPNNWPGPFFNYQYSISIKEKPEWAVVTVVPSESMLSPGDRENISIVVSVKETAPAYEYGVIRLDIESGLFGRNKMLGKWIPSYPFDTEFTIQAGYLPFLSTKSSAVMEGKPNSQITHIITVENSGNAQSKLDFSVNVPEAKQEMGWSAQQPTSVYLNVGQSMEIPFTVITPNSFGHIDDWAQISLDVKVSSPLEPTSENIASFIIPTTSHCVGIFVPGVPSGDNPLVILMMIVAIIAAIIIFLHFRSKFTGKLKRKHKK